MLSYQHIYHAGNLADVHKHTLLCYMISYLIQKDKPVSYIETHAGRGLYDFKSQEAVKTGEASFGIEYILENNRISNTHPYIEIINKLRKKLGKTIYPGSPVFAANLLRSQDKIHLAELHPQEIEHLRKTMAPYKADIRYENGIKMANALIPPEPRRGLLLIDPSYELKDEYGKMAEFVIRMHRKWPVGIIALWYPVLPARTHATMLETLSRALPDALCHEVYFDKIKQNHNLQGSGMFIVNPPYGTKEHCKIIDNIYT